MAARLDTSALKTQGYMPEIIRKQLRLRVFLSEPFAILFIIIIFDSYSLFIFASKALLLLRYRFQWRL